MARYGGFLACRAGVGVKSLTPRFDPIPRVDGIEASADPLFEPRANIYLMSGRRRRAAGDRR
jgi:hypothetical protein